VARTSFKSEKRVDGLSSTPHSTCTVPTPASERAPAPAPRRLLCRKVRSPRGARRKFRAHRRQRGAGLAFVTVVAARGGNLGTRWYPRLRVLPANARAINLPVASANLTCVWSCRRARRPGIRPAAMRCGRTVEARSCEPGVKALSTRHPAPAIRAGRTCGGRRAAPQLKRYLLGGTNKL